jgi:diguanylate cyclase (GGDEF)-like protein
MATQLDALIVAPDDAVAESLEHALLVGGLGAHCRRASDAAEMAMALAGANWDIVLAELDAPGFSATEAVEVLAEHGRDIPLIAIPEYSGLEPIVDLVNRGLRNVVSREHLDRLATTVELEISRRDARRRQRELEAELRRQANHDSLTDLPNRRLFFDRLSQGLKRARRQRGRLSLLFIDLDDFKAINDARGHAFGDALLQEVSRRLEHTIRESDTAARLGGDEFAVILDGVVEDGDAASAVADKIRQSLAPPFQLAGGPHRVSASIGAATYPTDGEDVDTLLSFADASMYRQKKMASRARGLRSGVRKDHVVPADVPLPGSASLYPNPLTSVLTWAAVVPAVAVLFFAGWMALKALSLGITPETPRLAGDDGTDGGAISSDIDIMPASGPAE